jgi:hypothetical protein
MSRTPRNELHYKVKFRIVPSLVPEIVKEGLYVIQ